MKDSVMSLMATLGGGVVPQDEELLQEGRLCVCVEEMTWVPQRRHRVLLVLCGVCPRASRLIVTETEQRQMPHR